MNRIISASLIIPVAIGAWACSDHPASPDNTPSAHEQPGIMISNARLSSAAVGATAASGFSIVSASEASVAYVSAVPQTFHDALPMEIRNRTTGGSARLVKAIDGGLDPVPIEARAADVLEMTISGAGGATTSMTLKVPPRRPPSIVRSIPANGLVDVALTVPVRVIFTEPIDPKTLSPTSLRLLHDGTPVAGSVRLSENGLTADFVPDNPLERRASYEIVVTPDIRDADGDALDASYSAKFTTVSEMPVSSVTISVDQAQAAAFLEGSGPYTITATALVRDGFGNEVSSGAIVWTAPSGGTVTPTGSRTALLRIAWTSGTASFTATIGGMIGTLDITVRRRPDQPFMWTRESGIVALPLPAGVISATPVAINDRGDVIGTMRTTEAGPSTRGFIWSASKGLRDLGTIGGTSGEFSTYPTAINSNGRVTGTTSRSGVSQAFIWTEESGMGELGPAPRGSFAYAAYGINASDYVIGEYADSSHRYRVPFRWNAATGFENLPLTSEAPIASPVAINNAGQIVGYEGSVEDCVACDFSTVRGILWNPDGERVVIPGSMFPTAINGHGQVVGDANGFAFRWTRSDGRTPFPAIQGAEPTSLKGINDAGDVVGSMILNHIFQAHGFLWTQAGTVTDLGFLPGTLSTVATAINNSGQVVGYSR